MQLLHAVLGDERNTSQMEKNKAELKASEGKSLISFLQGRKLSPDMTHLLVYAVAMADKAQTTESAHLISLESGLRSMRTLLGSIGRYGPGAYLFPMYGISELPQAFSRLCAVNKGIYLLRWPPKRLVMDKLAKNKCHGIISKGNQLLTAKFVVSDPDYAPAHFYRSDPSTVSRAVVIMDSLIKGPAATLGLDTSSQGASSQQDESAVLSIPPTVFGNKHCIRGIQLDSSLQVCPSGKVLLYLWTPADRTKTAEDDLRAAVEHFTCDMKRSSTPTPKKPSLLWVAYYRQMCRMVAEESGINASPVWHTSSSVPKTTDSSNTESGPAGDSSGEVSSTKDSNSEDSAGKGQEAHPIDNNFFICSDSPVDGFSLEDCFVEVPNAKFCSMRAWQQ